MASFAHTVGTRACATTYVVRAVLRALALSSVGHRQLAAHS
ncbi:MAG: hypothetical protein PHQ87_02020 [Hydrogenophaga sp.]|jgi:hypothetical protein|nr:hypothetical protein [Hydrogenophaga sp.]MDD3784305.1 hypothetical protein [Hydrogenophaga sp.]MDX9968561.1 hypothetical protein [Hydrogenophaga sp.]